MIAEHQQRPRQQAASAGWMVVYAWPDGAMPSAISPMYESQEQVEVVLNRLRARGPSPGEYLAAQLWRLP